MMYWYILFFILIDFLLTDESTPWKIHMEPTNHPFKKGKWSEPNLHGIMVQPLIFQGDSFISSALTWFPSSIRRAGPKSCA